MPCSTSFGVVCFEVASRKEPFKGKRPARTIGAVLYRGERPQVPKGASASPDVVTLMEQCWKQDSAQRPDGFTPVVEALESVEKRVGEPRMSDGLATKDAKSPPGMKCSGDAPRVGTMLKLNLRVED